MCFHTYEKERFSLTATMWENNNVHNKWSIIVNKLIYICISIGILFGLSNQWDAYPGTCYIIFYSIILQVLADVFRNSNITSVW